MRMEEIQIQSLAEPAKIKLIRGARGVYQWEISISGETLDVCVKKIHTIDALLAERYIPQGGNQ